MGNQIQRHGPFLSRSSYTLLAITGVQASVCYDQTKTLISAMPLCRALLCRRFRGMDPSPGDLDVVLLLGRDWWSLIIENVRQASYSLHCRSLLAMPSRAG